MALPIFAALIGGAIQAGAASKAAKQQTDALNKSTQITTQYADAAMKAQQKAAKQAAGEQVLGYTDAANALVRGAKAGGADQVAGFGRANAILGDFSDEARSAYNPYVQAGQTGMNALLAHLQGDSGYQESAGYRFRKKQGEDAIAAAAAKYGNLFSGATGQALVDYNQDLAATDDQRYFNNLMQTTGMGQSGTNALMSILQGVSAQQGQNEIGIGSAKANVDFNIANALADKFNNIGAANANKFLNIGNAAANAANVVGGVAGASAAQIGASQSAGTIGFGNAVNDAIGQGIGAWQYNQMLKQQPNYAG